MGGDIWIGGVILGRGGEGGRDEDEDEDDCGKNPAMTGSGMRGLRGMRICGEYIS